jgi:hypothetical protein
VAEETVEKLLSNLTQRAYDDINLQDVPLSQDADLERDNHGD